MVDFLVVQALPLPLLGLHQRLFRLAQRFRSIFGHGLIGARFLY